MLCTMASLKNLILSSLALAVIAAAPLTAHAIEVECSLEGGSTCTVSNDPFDNVTCDCADEGGSGTVGGNTWEGFDEEMMLEVCEAQLSFCEVSDTEVGPTSTSAGTFGSDTEFGTGGDTESGFDTEGSTGDGTTGYGTTGYGESSTGGGGPSSSTGDGPTSASASGPSTDPADTTGGSASGGTDTSPTPGSSSGGAAGESSSSGADGDSEDPSGCSVGTSESGGALFAVFGLLLGLRRRR